MPIPVQTVHTYVATDLHVMTDGTFTCVATLRGDVARCDLTVSGPISVATLTLRSREELETMIRVVEAVFDARAHEHAAHPGPP